MKRSKLKRVSPSRAVFLVVAVLFLLAIALVCFLPIWHVIMASISNPTQVNVSKGLILFPLGNMDTTAYKMLLSYQSLWSGYRNTIFYIILSCAITGTLTIVAGFVFSRNRFFYRNTFMLIISFTMLFNGGMIPTYMVIRNIGMVEMCIRDRFYRGKQSAGVDGVGIGLYLTRDIVNKQNGYIKVASDENGSTFSLFLKKD